MGGQLDGNFLTGSLPHKFILIVTSIICLWWINISLCLDRCSLSQWSSSSVYSTIPSRGSVSDGAHYTVLHGRYGDGGADADGPRQQRAVPAHLLRHRLLSVQLHLAAAAARRLQHSAHPHLPWGMLSIGLSALPVFRHRKSLTSSKFDVICHYVQKRRLGSGPFLVASTTLLVTTFSSFAFQSPKLNCFPSLTTSFTRQKKQVFCLWRWTLTRDLDLQVWVGANEGGRDQFACNFSSKHAHTDTNTVTADLQNYLTPQTLRYSLLHVRV